MLINVLSFIFVFTIIALSHEIGHLIWAKRAGIRVHEFALGFGPRLLSFTWDNTAYSLNLIPILGYVKIAGEGDNKEDLCCPEHELFYAKTPAQKFKALVAGSLMNILLAFILLSLTFMFAGVPAELSNEIGSVAKRSPAASAGLKTGDRLLAINGQPFSKMEEAIGRIHKSGGETLVLTIARGSRKLDIKATPKYDPSLKVSILGFSPKPSYKKVNPFMAIYYGLEQTLSLVLLMFVVVWKLVSGAVSLSNLAGPVGIAQISGKYAQSGFNALIYFTALISVNIGVLNLLPLPALDGGRLVFILIEWVRKKPVDPHLENKIHFWGMAALLSLMALITFNDIVRIIKAP